MKKWNQYYITQSHFIYFQSNLVAMFRQTLAFIRQFSYKIYFVFKTHSTNRFHLTACTLYWYRRSTLHQLSSPFSSTFEDAQWILCKSLWRFPSTARSAVSFPSWRSSVLLIEAGFRSATFLSSEETQL